MTNTTVHPEVQLEVNKMYKQLALSHPHTLKQVGGSLKLLEYAKKIVHIQAEIDTAKLLLNLERGK